MIQKSDARVVLSVSAPCGSGKTTAASQHAKRLAAQGQKTLLLQPTKELIDKTLSAHFADGAVRVRAIHTGLCDEPVAELVRHLREADPLKGEILLATHAAFFRLPFIQNRHRWHVVVDEAFAPDWCEQLNLHDNHGLLTPLLRIEPHDALYARLLPEIGCEGRLRKIAENEHGDDVNALLSTLAAKLLSPHAEVFTLEAQYQRLLARSGNRLALHAFALTRPSIFDGFASVTVMSAAFDSTALHQLWTAEGVRFRPHRQIERALRYRTHSNGALLTVYYALNEGGWSKHLSRQADCETGSTALHTMARAAEQVIGDASFVWQANKDAPADLFNQRGTRLPNVAHGLNDYLGVNNAIILPAINPTPAHYRWLDTRGMNSAAVKAAVYRSSVYQAASRISLRDPANAQPKVVVVADAETAFWLEEQFPGATVRPLPGMPAVRRGSPGRPRAHIDDAARRRAHKSKVRAELVFATRLLNNELSHEERATTALRLRVANQFQIKDETFEPNIDMLRRCFRLSEQHDIASNHANLFGSKKEAAWFHTVDEATCEDFIAFLRDAHAGRYERKDDNILLSAGFFERVPGERTIRGKANLTHVNGIFLDNDGGGISPEEFAELFPHLRVVVFNSFSSTKAFPRWRAYIPTSHLMPVEVHVRIMREIMLVLRAYDWRSAEEIAKYPRTKAKPHGFDMGKLTGTSLFYLPCQAGAGPEHSFFIDFARPGRGVLNVLALIENSIQRDEPPPPISVEHPASVVSASLPSQSRAAAASPNPTLARMREALATEATVSAARIREAAIVAAIDRWRAAPRGNGNRAFFQLAVDLRKAGVEFREIASRLREEAASAHSPSERRAEIAAIMRKIAKGN